MIRSATIDDAARLTGMWRSAGLRAGSALTGAGPAALFSRTLADAGISCNVIAGLTDDHLFVGWDQGPRALALLGKL